MNKISNLSMMVSSLLFLCISIPNVYGADPWKFFLNFGRLTDRIHPAGTQLEGLYYVIECNEDEKGEGKWIWKSTVDGYDYLQGEDSTYFPFNINGQDSIMTSWHIKSRDYYYQCDLYLYQRKEVGVDDVKMGHGYINLEDYTDIDEPQNVIITDPDNYQSRAWFDVDISGDNEIYDGEWKYNFELRLNEISNLNPAKSFKNLYYQLECTDGDDLKRFISYEDGGFISPFSLPKGGDVDSLIKTPWQIDTKDLYFFYCDLWIKQKGTISDSYLAKSLSIPLNDFPDNQFKSMEMFFYKKGDDKGEGEAMFYLEYYASQIKERKTQEEIDEDAGR